MKNQSLKDGALRVCCLPIAGRENPYQHLMMEGLRSKGALDVRHGAPGKFFAALRTVYKHRPDVIHYDWIHRYFLRRHRLWTWLHAPVFILELLVVRHVFGCRVVWTMHNLVTHDAGADRLELWVRRRFARLCDWIRVFDESTAERGSHLLRVEKSSFRIVPEGSYVDYYPNTIDKEGARRRLGIKPNKFVLLYLGLIRPYKGIEDLLREFEILRLPNWVLVIAGRALDNTYAGEIGEQARGIKGVRLAMEYIPDEDLQTFFNASDVVVLPFKKVENSGSAVLAMGFGKPIIAPRFGVLSRRLQQQDELLYDHGMLSNALESISRLTSQHLELLGERNLRAVSRHRWEDFAYLFNQDEQLSAAPHSVEQLA